MSVLVESSPCWVAKGGTVIDPTFRALIPLTPDGTCLSLLCSACGEDDVAVTRVFARFAPDPEGEPVFYLSTRCVRGHATTVSFVRDGLRTLIFAKAGGE